MKKAVIVTNIFYKKNRLFDINDNVANRDNCLYPFYLLKQKFLELNIDLVTSDFCTFEKAEFIIYNEMPSVMPKGEFIKKSFLLLLENELIRPDNWNIKKFNYFQKIFTWYDDFVDDKNIFKVNYTFKIPKSIPKDLAKKKNLCTLISGNRKSSHPLELYSKRIEAIRWFENNHPNEFNLYGTAWDEYRTENRYINFILAKVKWFGRLFGSDYPSYRGKVECKIKTFKNYKFAICYENARDIPGYITEKIFDCFFAGCVPIYWGANNIAYHIPEECFIDKRKFSSYEDLYEFISGMDDEVYMNYLCAIDSFIKSPRIYSFSSDGFVDTICREIKKQIKLSSTLILN